MYKKGTRVRVTEGDKKDLWFRHTGESEALKGQEPTEHLFVIGGFMIRLTNGKIVSAKNLGIMATHTKVPSRFVEEIPEDGK